MTEKIIIATVMLEHGATGVQTHFRTFKQYLLDRNIEVVVINPYCSYWWLVKSVFKITRIIDKFNRELGVWLGRYWEYTLLKQALAAQIQNDSSVVLYAQCPISVKAALDARHSSKQKVIMVTHFNVSQADECVGKRLIKKGGWVYQTIEKLENETIPLVDGIIYVSKFMKETLESRIPGVAKVKSDVLSSFITKPIQLDSIDIKRNLINIGHLEHRKNQSYILCVLSEAKKLGRLYSLTFIGDGEIRGKLEELAKSLGVEEQVKFLGFQKNAAQFLYSHSVYVHSALMENSPTVIIEALACGLPVLAAPVGGIPEIFSDGVEGLYWSLDNPTAAAEKLIALMEDTETINRMAKAAQLRFSSNFESSIVANRLLSFLYEVSKSRENAASHR